VCTRRGAPPEEPKQPPSHTVAIRKLPCRLVIATASPMINSVRDWYGILRFVWPKVKKPMCLAPVDPNKKSFTDRAYNFREKYDRDFFRIPPGKQDGYIQMLEPENFLAQLGPN